MKFIYFGTPDFAAKILNALMECGWIPQAIVTNPDRAQGRSGVLQPTAVKQLLLDRNSSIPIYQPEKASSEEFKSILEPYDADLFIVVAYGEIIKQHLLDMPKYGCINVHASLLPKYRGAAPIQWAIIEGEVETGISIMYLVKKMDAGNVILQERLHIEKTITAGELEAQLVSLGASALEKVLALFEKGAPPALVQDEQQVSFAPKLHLEDGEIHWDLSAQSILNRIRGVSPRPGAWCQIWIRGELRRLKILKATLFNAPNQDDPYRLFVKVLDGVVELTQIQLEGKKPMRSDEFLRGFPIEHVSFKRPS